MSDPKDTKELSDEQLASAQGGKSDVQSSEMGPTSGEERERGVLSDEQLASAQGGKSDLQSSEMGPTSGEERERGFEQPSQ